MSEYIITDEQIAENRRLHGRKLLIMPVIVRCRDCKWMSKDTVHYKACYRLHAIEFMVEPDGFCAWGERKD